MTEKCHSRAGGNPSSKQSPGDPRPSRG